MHLFFHENKENVTYSELLCVCEACGTPFITNHFNYTKKSKLSCAQCGADDVYIVRVRSK